jgi:DNA replication protein DnaC
MSYSFWNEERELNGYEATLLQMSHLPDYQWIEADLVPADCDVESYDRLANIRERLDDFLYIDKNNLVICGKNLGCGKTSWAIKLLLTYIEQNAKRLQGMSQEEVDATINIALFIPTVPFLVEIKQFNNNKSAQELYTTAKDCELVVFDDIAAVNMSNYDYNILYALAETRVLSHLPSIYTTNCTSEEELSETLGPRLADRIWNTSTIIELKGKGFRGSK